MEKVLGDLAGDLRMLGFLEEPERPLFEVGAVSERELLQTLRLALPGAGDVPVPLARQGRGIQRMILVAILMRLAQAPGHVTIGGFEEPEEALEPLRQVQLAQMLVELAEKGGQVFIVTHSPEIARAFRIEDFLLLSERTGGAGARALRRHLSAPVRQTYERCLDGAVVRGLFARVPLLVEGPSDRAVLEVFWHALVRRGELRPAAQLGLDVVNCEGVPKMPMLAGVLDEAGKSVPAWCDQDDETGLQQVDRLREDGHCAALVLHSPVLGRQNLERALAFGCSLPALVSGMGAVAADRGYSWEAQRADLVSRCEGMEPAVRETLKSAVSLDDAFRSVEGPVARELAARALGAGKVAPFEMKGGRPARILAETIVEAEGVPDNFAQALRDLQRWILDGCARGTEIVMKSE